MTPGKNTYVSCVRSRFRPLELLTASTAPRITRTPANWENDLTTAVDMEMIPQTMTAMQMSGKD